MNIPSVNIPSPNIPSRNVMPGDSATVLSVNLGSAGPRKAGGVTGIDKRSTDRAVMVTAPGPKGTAGSGLAGDQVCNRRHHGGNDQAVYAYPREDLDDWQRELGRTLPNGSFGENLTTLGIDITHSILGETWQLGTDLVLQVTDPRIPCRTFADFLGERGWIRRFITTGATGTYLRVLQPGRVRAGDPVRVLDRPDHGVTVRTAFRAFTTEPGLLPLLTQVQSLSPQARRTVTNRQPIAVDSDPA